MTAVRFARLCSPISAQLNVPYGTPPWKTSKRMPSASAPKMRDLQAGAGRFPRRVELHPTTTSTRDFLDMLAVGTGEKQPIFGDQCDERVEGLFDMVQISVDVRMIELHGGHNRALRPVMDELRDLVEVGRVVFVPLDHKGCALAPNTEVFAEVLENAAHKKSGVHPERIETPGQQGAGRGLAMSARDHDRVAVLEEELKRVSGKEA